MGDTVQRLMEDMVPELEDLQQKRIFNKVEIQSLVSHRQSFEYKLRRKNISKLDFLRYIQYELNVTALVDRRKEKIGIEKKGVCDFSAMRRLAFLYERALRKFNHDIPLWKQYLEYCRRTGSHHAISKILPRALQLNPKEESLWILHASWELEFQGNMDGGRAVLQRALRLNENSRSLWLAFTKMELRFIARILERKRALGIVTDVRQEQVGEFDLRFHGGTAEGEEEAKKDPLAARQEEALTQAIIPRAIMRNAVQVKGLKGALDFRLDFLRLIPSAYSAALSALDATSDDDSDDIPSTDASKLSLGQYAYNHNPDDVLLTNFLRYNGKTNAQIAKENQTNEDAPSEDGAAAAVPAAQHSRHLYHVEFLPLLNELFTGVRRDFAHEVHTLRLLAQFTFTRARVQVDLSESSPDAASPEQQAFDVFETALQPAELEQTVAAAQAYYQSHQVEVDVDHSPAGRALRDRLTNVERYTWQAYIEMTYGLLRQQPTNVVLRDHLQQLYVRAAAAGARTERVLLQQVSFLLETGQPIDAVRILSAALTPAAADADSSFARSVPLWCRYLELVEKMHAFHACAGQEVAHGKKRKAATSSASSDEHTVSFVCAQYDRALRSIDAHDRSPIFERLISFHCGQLACAPTRDAMLASYANTHAAFRRVLTAVPQPRGAEGFKVRYLQWMAAVATGESYAIMQRRTTPTTVKPSQSKKQKKSPASSSSAASDDDEDDTLPSYIPSLSLPAATAVRQVMDSLLATPPAPFDLFQACINVESTLQPSSGDVAATAASPSAATLSHQRRMKDLFERGVLVFGAESAEMWFAYLAWARMLRQPSQIANPNQIHFRATKELKPEHQAHWAELQTVLVQ